MLRLFFKPFGCRGFCNSRVLRSAGKEKDVVKQSENKESVRPPGATMDFAPSEFEKTVLVLSGRYKSKDSIPARISFDAMENAKSRIRIRGATILMVATLGLCGYYVYKGKKMVSEGDSMIKRYAYPKKGVDDTKTY